MPISYDTHRISQRHATRFTVWGNADEPYSPKTMTTKQENIIFLNKLKSLNKQGIITMRINFSDAQEHTTLWNKDRFMDSSNYLVEYIIMPDITTLS